MKRIALPKPIFNSSQRLDVSRQFIEAIPETPMRSGIHGISLSRPARMSSSISRMTASNLPSAMSRLICSSHSSSFQPCSHAASSARSSKDNCSIAFLIWSILTLVNLTGASYLSNFSFEGRAYHQPFIPHQFKNEHVNCADDSGSDIKFIDNRIFTLSGHCASM